MNAFYNTVKFNLTGKDPDLPEAMRKWLECGEYYSAECVVDTETGKGMITFRKNGGVRG